MLALEDPVVVVPIIECGNNCGNLPGLDWLWLTLGTLGAIGLLVVLLVALAAWLES